MPPPSPPPLDTRVKKNQPLLHARVKALPWRQIPVASSARGTGHGRLETRTLKTGHVSHLDFPHARQAIKITRCRQDTTTGKTTRQTAYAITSLTSARATGQDLARLIREHWSIEAHHHIRDVTFSEDTATNRTGNGPANLATTFWWGCAVRRRPRTRWVVRVPTGRCRLRRAERRRRRAQGTALPDEVRGPATHPPTQPRYAGAEPRHVPGPGAGGHVAWQRRRRHQPSRQSEQAQNAPEPFGFDDAARIELVGQQLGEVVCGLRVSRGGGEGGGMLDAEWVAGCRRRRRGRGTGR
jgi:hypothetical protein